MSFVKGASNNGQDLVLYGNKIIFNRFIEMYATSSLIIMEGSNGELRLDLTSANSATFTSVSSISTVFFTLMDVSVPGNAYSSSWNGSNLVPTRNDVYDKIETMRSSSDGIYNVTTSNVSNVDGVLLSSANFLRVGSTVNVSGIATVDPTVAATSTFFSMSLPISSSFTALQMCAGVSFCNNVAGQGAVIIAETGAGVARFQFVSGDTTSQLMPYFYQYRIA